MTGWQRSCSHEGCSDDFFFSFTAVQGSAMLSIFGRAIFSEHLASSGAFLPCLSSIRDCAPKCFWHCTALHRNGCTFRPRCYRIFSKVCVHARLLATYRNALAAPMSSSSTSARRLLSVLLKWRKRLARVSLLADASNGIVASSVSPQLRIGESSASVRKISF